MTVVGDEQIEVAIEIEIGDARAHSPVGGRPRHAADAERRGDVFEAALVLAIQAVGLAFLVRGEQIEIAVAIEVPPHRADGLAGIADAARLGDIDEAAAIVAQQPIRHVAEGREQIEVAVAVVINPGGLARHAVQHDADLLRDVDESRALGVVAIDLRGNLRIGEPDIEIGVAVGVEVAPRRRARFLGDEPSVVDQPDLLGDVAEDAVVVSIEPVRPAAKRDEVIQVAVVVGVGPRIRLPADGANSSGWTSSNEGVHDGDWVDHIGNCDDESLGN